MSWKKDVSDLRFMLDTLVKLQFDMAKVQLKILEVLNERLPRDSGRAALAKDKGD